LLDAEYTQIRLKNRKTKNFGKKKTPGAQEECVKANPRHEILSKKR
jgi:hypothetical protein